MTVVLALDVSQRATGFAMDGPTGRPLTGTWGVPARCADHGEIGLAFMRWLRPLVGNSGAGILAFEAPMVPSGGSWNVPTNAETIQTLIGLCWAAQIVAAEKVIRVAGARPQTVRKHFCGSGHAKKPEVQARCRMLGWTFKTPDEADACALWSWAKSTYDRDYRPHAVTELFAGARA